MTGNQDVICRDVARIMEKYRHKLRRRCQEWREWGSWLLKGVHVRRLPETHDLYNRNGDVFDHFGSAFNNMKFRLCLPFFENTTTN